MYYNLAPIQLNGRLCNTWSLQIPQDVLFFSFPFWPIEGGPELTVLLYGIWKGFAQIGDNAY